MYNPRRYFLDGSLYLLSPHSAHSYMVAESWILQKNAQSVSSPSVDTTNAITST